MTRSDRKTMTKVSAMIVRCCLNTADQNGGKLPYGFIRQIVKQHAEKYPFITEVAIRKALERQRKRAIRPSSPSASPPRPSPSPNPSPPVFESESVTESEISNRKVGGRPKGTSKVQKDTDHVAYLNFLNVLAKRLRERHDPRKCSFPPGLTQEVIDEVAREYDMVGAYVSARAIRKRVHKNKLEVVTKGNPSPTIKLDEALVEIILKLAQIRHSISPSEAIALANSLVDEQELGEEIKQYKLAMGYNVDDSGRNQDGSLLGKRWWQLFLRRNEHRLISAKGKKFALNRDDWCIYTNFVTMYDLVYEGTVTAKIAEKLETPEWLDFDGNKIGEGQAVGRKSTHRLICPKYGLVVDETGGNTSMKNDGHGSNKKYLTAPGDTPRIRSSESDNHFTTMCFTALTGDPVLCVTIFKGE